MKNYLIGFIALVLSSCNQKETTTTVENSDTVVAAKDSVKEVQTNHQIADTIDLVIKDEKGIYNAIGSIDSIHSHIYLKFETKHMANLKATVSPVVGRGNIRFNQIIFPDKTMDGPFANEMEHELSMPGKYQLIIGRSLMADQPYEGKFKVEVEVTE